MRLTKDALATWLKEYAKSLAGTNDATPCEIAKWWASRIIAAEEAAEKAAQKPMTDNQVRAMLLGGRDVSCVTGQVNPPTNKQRFEALEKRMEKLERQAVQHRHGYRAESGGPDPSAALNSD